MLLNFTHQPASWRQTTTADLKQCVKSVLLSAFRSVPPPPPAPRLQMTPPVPAHPSPRFELISFHLSHPRLLCSFPSPPPTVSRLHPQIKHWRSLLQKEMKYSWWVQYQVIGDVIWNHSLCSSDLGWSCSISAHLTCKPAELCCQSFYSLFNSNLVLKSIRFFKRCHSQRLFSTFFPLRSLPSW